jgi:hypothetical protein
MKNTTPRIDEAWCKRLARALTVSIVMSDRHERADEHLHLDPAQREVIAKALRERRAMPARNTVAVQRRWWVPLTLAIVVLAACSGGGKRTDTYAKATDVQSDCCEHLHGPDRDHCLGDIVRIDDPQAAKTSTSQATYACVVEHFVCDPQTGKPTQTSAQAQYDCIEDQAR